MYIPRRWKCTMDTKTSISFSCSSPIADWYMRKWQWLKLRLGLHSRRVLWLTNILRPTLACRETTMKLIWGTVYVTRREKVDLIDGKRRQECSLKGSWKARHESWPVMFFDFGWKICFLRNKDTQNVLLVSLAWWLIHSFWGYLHEYWSDWLQLKRFVFFVELEILEQNGSYHFTMVILSLTILPWHGRRLSVSIKIKSSECD